VCEQLGRVDCRRPFGVRGRKKERNRNWIWELIVEVVTHPWREAGSWTQPIGGACDLSGSNRHYHAGIDEGRSAVRMCCLVDGWEALSEESQMHLLEVKVCESDKA
jgi:hypothetical protein